MQPTEASPSLSVLPYLTERPTDRNIYQSIGVEPIINCRGTFTILGGSVELPEVLAAMEAASGYFAQYDELAAAVGQRLADITGAEWGLIAAGCAAGIKHVTIACVTGGNPEKLIRVPDLTGFDRTQVIIPGTSRNAYDHAVRNVGVDVVTVDTPEELERAIGPQTAMIYLTTGGASEPDRPLSLERIAAIAHPLQIPILADAAAEDLTIPSIHLQRGATVVAYSGGKALCGPQCAGLVLGRKDLLISAWQASSPHHGPGRDNKIGKEEIMGMLAAVEAWVTRDHTAEWETWLALLETISQRVTGIPGVSTRVTEPTGLNNRSPTLTVSWDPDSLHITGEEVAEDFARNAPRIAIGCDDGAGEACLRITPSQMQPGDEIVVADRIHHILATDRNPRVTDMQPAGTDLSGSWDLRIEYSTSTSQHRLLIQQEGNWITGTHESDFTSQPLHGTVEGDQVKLESVARKPGDSVPFLFGGTIGAGSFSGSIHLGEYLTAEFTAERTRRDDRRRRISIPGGPPLAT
ncbi:MAG TPA: selenocysteine synthase [Candidatus Latescibacteria bacterium]|nr:selenocysteine synthase [Candidatus Latescibacterota bacterium]